MKKLSKPSFQAVMLNFPALNAVKGSKSYRRISLLLLSFLLLSATSCNNDDDNNCQGIDCLPPATQTGEGTFGCLVNGVPFVDNSGFFNCFYQLVDGEYYFGIGSDKELLPITQIIILSWMQEIEIGTTIELESRNNGNFFSEIAFDCFCPNATTTDGLDGNITFTEFNINSNIVSAIFEFTVIDPSTGTVYEITEGRFDSFFTQ
ncbi:hypothetical protein [Winogradskyella poriferorum]|uniref:hypothetical protein n=1 Tax=Winogradskyella poriferorum TaxID=307627 RepID=UPI003D65DDA1